MSTYSARALVLQRTKLGESDLILTMLSDSGEIIRAVAKGARKPKSRLGSSAGLFRCNDWLLHRGRNLDIVTEARTFAAHTNLSVEYRTALAAGVISEFVVKTHLMGQSDARIYDMTMATLSLLEDLAVGGVEVESVSRSIDGLVLSYVIKSLAMHGYRPSTSVCAECGVAVDSPPDRVEWSPGVAGVVCDLCAPHAADSRLIPAAASSWIGYMLGARLPDVARADIPVDALDDLFIVVIGLVDTHVQARLRSLDVYRSERQSCAALEGRREGLDGPSLR